MEIVLLFISSSIQAHAAVLEVKQNLNVQLVESTGCLLFFVFFFSFRFHHASDTVA